MRTLGANVSHKENSEQQNSTTLAASTMTNTSTKRYSSETSVSSASTFSTDSESNDISSNKQSHILNLENISDHKATELNKPFSLSVTKDKNILQDFDPEQNATLQELDAVIEKHSQVDGKPYPLREGRTHITGTFLNEDYIVLQENSIGSQNHSQESESDDAKVPDDLQDERTKTGSLNDSVNPEEQIVLPTSASLSSLSSLSNLLPSPDNSNHLHGHKSQADKHTLKEMDKQSTSDSSPSPESRRNKNTLRTTTDKQQYAGQTPQSSLDKEESPSQGHEAIVPDDKMIVEMRRPKEKANVHEKRANEQLHCCNHDHVTAQRFCASHGQAVCLECAFEFHRSCPEVDVLAIAAADRRKELSNMCEQMLFLKAEWESCLEEMERYKIKLKEEKEKSRLVLKETTEQFIAAIKEKETELRMELETLFASEETTASQREADLRHALANIKEVYIKGDDLINTGGESSLLNQYSKIKTSCDAVIESEIHEISDILKSVTITTKFLTELKVAKLAELKVERQKITTKNQQISERGLETFRKISVKRRQIVTTDTYQNRLSAPHTRTGPRASMSRSVASSRSLGSTILSTTTNMAFLEGPQSMFEFWAGLETDKYPFGLGDICVLQPRATILITYLTSDILRIFPWKQESAPFVSEPLGCTLCCVTQLTLDIVAVTSSNSDQLSFLKVEMNSVKLMHAVTMKKQYRAVTSLDYRTLALATDSKKWSNNVIHIIRFDSTDFRNFTLLRTIGARAGSFPKIKLLSRTLYKVPYSMTVSHKGHIVVSDSENKALLSLAQDGRTHFLFQPPKQSNVIDTPGGVACSPSGFLYLVDSCEQRVLRFNPRGKFLKMVLSQEDGLEWPVGVACVDDSTLCVAEFYGQIKVFQIR